MQQNSAATENQQHNNALGSTTTALYAAFVLAVFGLLVKTLIKNPSVMSEAAYNINVTSNSVTAVYFHTDARYPMAVNNMMVIVVTAYWDRNHEHQ